MADTPSQSLGSANLSDLVNAFKAQALNMGAFAQAIQALSDAVAKFK